MKAILFLVLIMPVCVLASDLQWYKDEGCGEPLLEVKKSKQTTVKTENFPLTFAVGVCTTFENNMPIYSVTTTTAAGDATVKHEVKYTYSTACSEYGGANVFLIGSQHKDCIIDEEFAEAAADGEKPKGFVQQLGGVASFCSLSNESNKLNNDGVIYYEKINCNPNNASVAGIILGTVGLVLSLAAVALAAMAAGKKGSSAPPAKPAAPAGAPAEGEMQGSQTAAQAVGNATEA